MRCAGLHAELETHGQRRFPKRDELLQGFGLPPAPALTSIGAIRGPDSEPPSST